MKNQLYKGYEEYKGLLDYYMDKLNLHFTEPAVLNVACGKCYEAQALFELFGDDITMIDRNNRNMEELQKRIGNERGNLLVNDAENLTKIMNIQLDIVIARHPDIFESNWKKIYRECFKVTKQNGFLVSTFYMSPEHKQAEYLVRSAGYIIKISEENPFSVINPDNSIRLGEDRFIIVGVKKKMPLRLLKFFMRI